MTHPGDLIDPAPTTVDALDYQLCYVEEGGWAYFANVPPTEMSGDDWNDAPHSCNASQPYPREGQEVAKVAFDGDLELVDSWQRDDAHRPVWAREHQDHYVSADDCNSGEVPWLIQPSYGLPQYPQPVREIHGGTTLRDFMDKVKMAGGRVYEAIR